MKHNFFFFIILFSLAFCNVNIYGQTVSTFAGSGTLGSTEGNGTTANFNRPVGIAINASGDLFVSDQNNHKIRKISPSGLVTTFAGSGSAGNVDGIGTAATFNKPAGLVFDSAGNLYVSDLSNNKIRKISPTGVVTSFAGSGAQGNTDGLGVAASFNGLSGITIDTSDNLFVVDSYNFKIRKITPTGVVTTFAGNGTQGNINGIGTAASFNFAYGISIDNSDNLYIGDVLNYSIRKITPTGVVSTFAGTGVQGTADGTSTTSSFSGGNGIAVDSNGNVFISDNGNNKIRKISTTGIVTTYAGTGTTGNNDGASTSATFNSPAGLVFDASGDLFICEHGNNKIRKITETLSIEDFNNNNLKIYPNPTNNIINIELKESFISKIELLDINGRVLITKYNNSVINQIDLSEYCSAIYLLKISINNNSKTFKIVKQ